MKSVLEHCIEHKADRFLVYDDGSIFMQAYGGSTIALLEADTSTYLRMAKTMRACGDRRKANELVPKALRSDWKLSAQRQDGYTVWTLYLQRLPTLEGVMIADTL